MTKTESKTRQSKPRSAKGATVTNSKEAKAVATTNPTKKDIVLELLRRKKGATLVDIAKATGWQNHSIHGFMSGTIRKKMGLAVNSAKNEAGERTYRVTQ
jgi:hypothetical protein